MAERRGNEHPQRPVHNMQSLLNFCTEITAREDTTTDSAIEMSQERREFLEKVLTGMQGDVASCMAGCLQKLTQECVSNSEDDVSEQVDALDQLSEYVEDLNYAIDLDKMNGFPVLVKTLTCPHPSLQMGAAQVIGDVCQNNEVCQKSMLSLNTMEILLKIIDSHPDGNCKVKACYALSCLIREFEAAEKQFIDRSGFCYLMRAIQTKNPKLVVKSIFLLNYFIGKTDKHKDTLLAMGFVEQLVSVLFSEGDERTLREYCTLCLVNLASSYEKAAQECLRPEFQLVTQLQERRKLIARQEEFQDEDNHIKNLLKILEADEDKEDTMLR